jgi:NAD+ diphosphatase
MLVVKDGKCLLGRKREWPPGMYSALAGFIEPGETIEEAVRREVFEEAGIHTAKVRYSSSQPWPFPSSLMMGCIAEGISDDIVIDTDELEHAAWFTRAEVVAGMERALTTEAGDGLFRLPNPIAIAHQLTRAWLAETAD